MALRHPAHADEISGEIKGVTLATVDLDDRELVAQVRKRDLAAAGVRIRAAVRRMQELGVLDAEGRRISKELPPDMREESTTDFGG